MNPAPAGGVGGRAEGDRGVCLSASERDLLREDDRVGVGDLDPDVVRSGRDRQVVGGRAERDVGDGLVAVDEDVDRRGIGREVPDAKLRRRERGAQRVVLQPELCSSLGELAARERGVALAVLEGDVSAEHGRRRRLALRGYLHLDAAPAGNSR